MATQASKPSGKQDITQKAASLLETGLIQGGLRSGISVSFGSKGNFSPKDLLKRPNNPLVPLSCELMISIVECPGAKINQVDERG